MSGSGGPAGARWSGDRRERRDTNGHRAGGGTGKAGASRPGILTARDFDSTRARLFALLVERDLVTDNSNDLAGVLMLRRVGWGIADQALSSLTNFVLGIVMARSVDTTALGAFAFAFLAYAVGLGVNRAIAAQPLIIRYSATTPTHWARGVGVAGGVVVWVGLMSALIAAAIAALSSDALREAFFALALVFPGLPTRTPGVTPSLPRAERTSLSSTT